MGYSETNPDTLLALEAETAFQILPEADQEWIRGLSKKYRLSFQELRLLSENAKDLSMWGERSISVVWDQLELETLESLKLRARKDKILSDFNSQISKMKGSPKSYREPFPAPSRSALRLVTEPSDKQIFGTCPVASEKTVCCNLKTIDVVENCAYGCSYCTIQTFYGDKVVFHENLREKLAAIKLDPKRRYHIGTGQSSDSLVWGNKNGLLDDLCEFAQNNPNVLLEFKTKSGNASYFVKNDIPKNIVCSWSLNTEAIVNNEEHFTASLDERLNAAWKTAQSGTKVSFHFHPMVYHEGWEVEYPVIARRVMERFQPSQVLFISFGSVTFIKPVMKQIRKRGEPTKILQMEMVKDPHGKLTYPDDVKLSMFSVIYEAFKPWRNQVFQYLCMERAFFWDEVFGWHYPTNEEFEQALLESSFSKIG